jgi:hypothetical protein
MTPHPPGGDFVTTARMSASQLFREFRWDVAPAYEWKEWLDHGQPVRVNEEGLLDLNTGAGVEFAWNQYAKLKKQTGPVLCPTSWDLGRYRRYEPMHRRHAALFQTFAALDHRDLDSIRLFANRYGALGLEPQEQVVPADAGPYWVRGESYLDWAREICAVQAALQFTMRSATQEDIRQQQIRLDSHLDFVRGRSILEGNTFRYVNQPKNLLTILWVQLILAIGEHKQFGTCKYCRRPMELSTDTTGFRRHREFCSDTCKTNDYRKRKRTALRLAKEGSSVTTIAKQVGTPLATVRGWLGHRTLARDRQTLKRNAAT